MSSQTIIPIHKINMGFMKTILVTLQKDLAVFNVTLALASEE